MIKIIKTRELPKHDYTYRVTCKSCGTVFECNESDFHTEIVGFHDSDNIIYCPICQEGLSKRLAPWYCEVERMNEE